MRRWKVNLKDSSAKTIEGENVHLSQELFPPWRRRSQYDPLSTDLVEDRQVER